MVKMIIELEDKAHDDLIKVLKLCEPDKGYFKEKLLKYLMFILVKNVVLL